MASCVLQETSIDAAGDGKDTVTRRYLADLGSNIEDEYTALIMAQSLGPKPVPYRRQQHPSGAFVFAQNIRGQRTKENRDVWMFDVTYGPPEKGEDQTQQVENPLLRPPTYDIQYIEQEYVVKQARNVEALGAEFAAGGPYRPPGTLRAITNGAGTRPDEPIVRVERLGIIVITRNYSNLGSILDINEDYARTCNSDSITLGSKTFAARRLIHEVTRSGGKQVENDVEFYPGTTEISIHKTTDLVLDNVGYQYYSTGAELKRAVDADNEPTAEPVNLKLNGTKVGDGEDPTQITYRDLEEVAYSSFFS